jgi:hypothetical protein
MWTILSATQTVLTQRFERYFDLGQHYSCKFGVFQTENDWNRGARGAMRAISIRHGGMDSRCA